MIDKIGISDSGVEVAGSKSVVLSRVTCEFNPDGSVTFDGSLSNYLTVDDETYKLDETFSQPAVYPSVDIMIQLAAQTWSPSEAELEALSEQILSGAAGAAEAIFKGFVGISRAALETILEQQKPPPVPEPSESLVLPV